MYLEKIYVHRARNLKKGGQALRIGIGRGVCGRHFEASRELRGMRL